MLKFLTRLFGSKKEKDLQRLLPMVAAINAEWEKLGSLTDEELKDKTRQFRQQIQDAVQEMETRLTSLQLQLKEDLADDQRLDVLDEMDQLKKDIHETIEVELKRLLPEAFAVVKETCKRLVGLEYTVNGNKMRWDMVPYDVQLIGGVVIHEGKIAEMATGEGKTLVSTLPVYLNALPGKGVHLVTVNDYLAQRDSQWMGPVFEFHGLTVGCILNNMNPEQRKREYSKDITYGTNNEFGFDYLRDNMAIDASDIVHRGFNYVIIDEVDSVLIDEARTPLIISGPVAQSDQKYDEYKPRVELLYKAQSQLAARFLSDAEKALEAGNTSEAGLAMLRVHRGMPKNPRLLKMLSETGNKKLLQDTENEYLRENARHMHVVDDELYFSIEEKNHAINLTEKGREFLAKQTGDADLFLLPDIGSEMAAIENNHALTAEDKLNMKEDMKRRYADRSDRIHTVSQLLKAYTLYEADVEYVIQEGKILIVDEFTGRILPGRRYSDGLHQAIEAKEGVTVERDTQTFATITIQNYFRLYNKMAGMTGTAETEAGEFYDIYKLDVVVIPTNRDIVRDDREDLIYKTRREKLNAILNDIQACREQGRPVLVGTTSVEASEMLSRALKRGNIPHNVLNAKQHAREAEIVSLAGQKGAVTIATNMAGRGTDIKLGDGVRDLGGLMIIGTERHESRRIDRQLRGRSGRQGDPGASQFYISLEDDLMRLFGSDRIAAIMDRMGIEEGEVIQHSMVSKSIERAQKRVEENNFSIRKRLLEYDDVMNQQREIIYSRRREALEGQRLKGDILEMARTYSAKMVSVHCAEGDLEELSVDLMRNLLINIQFSPDELVSGGEESIREKVWKAIDTFYDEKETLLTTEVMKMLERAVVLQVIDERWREHLREMDDLKEGIGLRAYGQRDPLVEYKAEAYNLFTQLMDLISEQTVQLIFKAYPTQQLLDMSQERANQQRLRRQMVAKHEDITPQRSSAPVPQDVPGPAGQMGQRPSGPPPRPVQAPVKVEREVGRNEPCPCGSGKKYKVCHGR
ncbi:MAG: preprotein translocase subunit SecA [Bacteroidetes bacterium]|nr:preprotein translocase subunit SecA [Bacteroidota bacterium]